eukprot:s2015_g6.t1
MKDQHLESHLLTPPLFPQFPSIQASIWRIWSSSSSCHLNPRKPGKPSPHHHGVVQVGSVWYCSEQPLFPKRSQAEAVEYIDFFCLLYLPSSQKTLGTEFHTGLFQRKPRDAKSFSCWVLVFNACKRLVLWG